MVLDLTWKTLPLIYEDLESFLQVYESGVFLFVGISVSFLPAVHSRVVPRVHEDIMDSDTTNFSFVNLAGNDRSFVDGELRFGR